MRSFQSLFKRERQPGDIVFAIAFLCFSLFLVSQLGNQTTWVSGSKLFAQPAFWPIISLVLMTVFAIFHLIGSYCSPRIHGRMRELGFWMQSLEYAGWFMVYVFTVPMLGYLPTTIVFMCILLFRLGYREPKTIAAGAVSATAIVLVFKTFLQVKIPAGQIYEALPDGLRSTFLTYF